MRVTVSRYGSDMIKVRKIDQKALSDMLIRLSSVSSNIGNSIAMINYAVMTYAQDGSSKDYLVSVLKNAVDMISESEKMIPSESNMENIRSALVRLRSLIDQISAGASQETVRDLYSQILNLNSVYESVISDIAEKLKNVAVTSAD